MMTTKEYQEWVRSKWNNKDTLDERDHFIMATGLGGETGEVLEILKKSVRNKTPIDKVHLTEELGDVQYYLAMLCNYHGLSLEDVIKANVEKINIRYK